MINGKRTLWPTWRNVLWDRYTIGIPSGTHYLADLSLQLEETVSTHSQQQRSNGQGSSGPCNSGSTTSSSPNEMSGDLEKAFQILESVQDLQNDSLDFDDINLCLDPTTSHDTGAESSGESSTEFVPISAATTKVPLSNDFHLEFFSNSIECVPHGAPTRTTGPFFGIQAGNLMISPSTDSESSLSLNTQGFLTSGTSRAHNALPMLSDQEQGALQYYTEVVFPSLFSFLSCDVARDECKRTIETSRQRRVCLQYIVSHSARRQDAELRRFGLRLPESSVAHGATALDQQHQLLMLPHSGHEVDKECLLHILLAQVN